MLDGEFLYVRHAKSYGNKAYEEHGKPSWSDPSLFDAELTEEGI